MYLDFKKDPMFRAQCSICGMSVTVLHDNHFMSDEDATTYMPPYLHQIKHQAA